MKVIHRIALICLLLLNQNVLAEGTIISIEGATIRGNQELPTVLYLVPWQPAKVYTLDESTQTLASSRPIQQLDRSSFLRMQSYHKAFTIQSSENDTHLKN